MSDDVYDLSAVLNEEFRDTPRADRAAERILRSDWLARHDKRIAAEAVAALRPGGEKEPGGRPEWVKSRVDKADRKGGPDVIASDEGEGR